MCLFHKWDKWEGFDKEVPPRVLSAKWMLSGATEHWQKRICIKCGKIQHKYIGTTVR